MTSRESGRPTPDASGAPPPIAAVYLATDVTILERASWTSAADSELVRQGTVHVITAWNPGDERPSDEENHRANEWLRQRLEEHGFIPVPARGSDPDSDHAEDSWAVHGLRDDQACALGAEFGQVAVFRLTREEQTVLHSLGEWSVSRNV